MKHGARLLLAFGFGLAVGLGVETLMLVREQCRQVELGLAEEFRLLAFVREPAEAKLDALEERLRGLPGVQETRLVTPEESLGTLREEEPELVDALSWMGENPLAPAFELRLDPESLSRFPEWLAAAGPLAESLDIRYKAGQVRTILQLQFYRHFLGLVLSALLCLAALAAAAGVWAAGPERLLRHLNGALSAAAGAAAGLGSACLLVLPLRDNTAWWAVPQAPGQLALLAGATLLGWTLSPWLGRD